MQAGPGRVDRWRQLTSPAAPIVWIASYPKSGNTWTRVLLTNYLRGRSLPASINELVGGMSANNRELFDEYMGLESSDLTPKEIMPLRPRFQELLAAELPRPTFCKTHDAYLHRRSGIRLFSRTASAGVVYLVRSPLDVTVSLAHHEAWPLDPTVAFLGGAATTGSAAPPTRIIPSFWNILPPWSEHVTSWLEQREIPLHVARYEDLLADPVAGFGAIVRFAGLDYDEARLAQAIEHSAFDRLRAQEEQTGFVEKLPQAQAFFRTGAAGGWRTALNRRQVEALIDAHGSIMARFGYLRDAEAILAG